MATNHSDDNDLVEETMAIFHLNHLINYIEKKSNQKLSFKHNEYHWKQYNYLFLTLKEFKTQWLGEE